MPNAKAIRSKLTKKVIGKLGMDTVILRASQSNELDAYGEPKTDWVFDQIPIRIVIDTDKRDEDDSPIGGMPDKKKEFLCFYCSGEVDIRIGDKIVYPAGTDDQWLVDFIQPCVIKNIVVITEIKAFRDARY